MEQPGTKEVLQLIAKMATHIAKSADDTRAMLAIAADRSIEVSLEESEILNKFRPGNEYETTLLHLVTAVRSLNSDLFTQGLKVTLDDLIAKRKELGLEIQ